MKTITIQATIDSPVEKVWEYWTSPDHITKWNFASPEWHCPRAMNDLKNGGKFSWHMEAIDGSMGFDYSGTYRLIEVPGLIEKQLDGGRNVMIRFEWVDGKTLVTVRKHAELGQINREVVYLIPGRYTVTGVREGYRDVREELVLIAGQPVPALTIASTERVR